MEIKIINCESGEEVVRDLTSDEIADIETAAEADRKSAEKALKRREAKLALLEKLGITEEEAKILLG